MDVSSILKHIQYTLSKDFILTIKLLLKESLQVIHYPWRLSVSIKVFSIPKDFRYSFRYPVSLNVLSIMVHSIKSVGFKVIKMRFKYNILMSEIYLSRSCFLNSEPLLYIMRQYFVYILQLTSSLHLLSMRVCTLRWISQISSPQNCSR